MKMEDEEREREIKSNAKKKTVERKSLLISSDYFVRDALAKKVIPSQFKCRKSNLNNFKC